MLKMYKSIHATSNANKFSMPYGLRLIKECSENGIMWKELHIADCLSIIYSIRIDNIIRYKQMENNKRMGNKGIAEIKKANEKDFEEL